MGRAWVAVVQECRKAVADHAVLHGGREQLFLRVARQIRPNLECGVPEQACDLVFVHPGLPDCAGGKTVDSGIISS